MKALLLFALAFALYIGIRFTLKRIKEIQARTDSDENTSANQDKMEQMVCCEECHLRLPESEAVLLETENGSHYFFCGEAHQQAFIDKQKQ